MPHERVHLIGRAAERRLSDHVAVAVHPGDPTDADVGGRQRHDGITRRGGRHRRRHEPRQPANHTGEHQQPTTRSTQPTASSPNPRTDPDPHRDRATTKPRPANRSITPRNPRPPHSRPQKTSIAQHPGTAQRCKAPHNSVPRHRYPKDEPADRLVSVAASPRRDRQPTTSSGPPPPDRAATPSETRSRATFRPPQSFERTSDDHARRRSTATVP